MPKAQAPIVVSNVVNNTATESSPNFDVSFNAELVDQDGSEEISSIEIFVSGKSSTPLTRHLLLFLKSEHPTLFLKLQITLQMEKDFILLIYPSLI